MQVKTLFNVKPSILAISPTHKCTAACENCCIGCNPNIKEIIDYNTMISHIDNSFAAFPKIKVVVFTGGECTLLGEDLVNVIKYVTDKYKTVTRIVTNAHWATSYETAYKRLKELKDVGLTELNFSTGDDHQKFVKVEKIITAAKAACDLGFMTVLINIEAATDRNYTSERLKNDETLADLINEKKVMCSSGAWMPFKKYYENIASKNFLPEQNFERCTEIFKSITINPYSQMLACCGLTVEYNKFLKLGDISDPSISIKELYYNQFNDLYKIWLYTHGPAYILKKLCEHIGKEFTPKNHTCAYCIELIKPEYATTLKEIMKDELQSIIFKAKMLKTNFNIKENKGNNTPNYI